MAGQTVTDSSIVQMSYGTDDGVVYAISGGKIGFFGLATPVVKSTCTVSATVTAASTTTAANQGVAEIYAALLAYGLVA